MHIRKLVKAGQASHTVSLPKGWLLKNNLQKGDMVYINESSPTELTLTPEQTAPDLPSFDKAINIDNKDLASIRREITSAYINNCSSITILGKELHKNTKEIRDILNDFVALEIAEQTSTRIVAKDLLNLREISIGQTLKRMDMTLRSIISDALKTMEGEEMYESIHYRDADVNRIYFLLFRLLKSALDNPKVASQFGMTNSEALATWYLAVNIENIADNSKTLSDLLKDAKKSDAKSITEIYSEIEKSYLDAVKAFHKKDVSLAEAIPGRRITIFENCDSFLKKNPSYINARIVENLKDMSTNITNIARITMDMELPV